jgi:hypothetical protein
LAHEGYLMFPFGETRLFLTLIDADGINEQAARLE